MHLARMTEGRERGTTVTCRRDTVTTAISRAMALTRGNTIHVISDFKEARSDTDLIILLVLIEIPNGTNLSTLSTLRSNTNQPHSLKNRVNICVCWPLQLTSFPSKQYGENGLNDSLLLCL
jgi:hypothetical protein